ncbi:MAG: tetratricopeptide repeat protein [Ignavibacteriaceae bacterium]
MKLIKPAGAIVVFTILFFVSADCRTGSGEDKVPVTTSSEKAMEQYLEGRDLAERLRAQESIQYFTNAINEDPDFAMAYLLRVPVQIGAKELFEDLNKAVSLADKVSEGERLQILGLQAGFNGNTKKQEEYYSKLASMYPNDERALSLLANLYFGQQENQKAVDLYNKILKINPDFSPVLNQLGYAQRTLENYAEAEKAFKKYTELIPDDPNPYDSYAELLLKMGRFDESIEYYNKALQQNPDFIASYIGLSANYMYLGKYDAAHEQMLKLTGIAKNDGQKRTAMFIDAVIYIDEGKPDMAIKEFEKQITLDEKNKDYANISADILTIAIVLHETGKADEALQQFRKSVDVFDKSSAQQGAKDNARLTLLSNESKIAMFQGDYTTAKAKADEYMKGVTALNNPNQVRLAHELYGLLALSQEEADKALTELSKASSLNPYNFYRMAAAYRLKGDMEKAKEYCEKAINFNQLPNMNVAYARVRAKELMGTLLATQ